MSTGVPIPDPSAAASDSCHKSPTLERLPDDPATLKCMVLELLATLQQERQDKEALQHRLALLLRRLYGPRTERIDPAQGSLFDPLPAEDAPAASVTPAQQEEAANEPPAPRRRRARPHGRRPLPAHLPRKVVPHELTEAERLCGCGQVRVLIGIDKSEQLDWQPASLFVWEHHVHKYACPACAGQTSAVTDTPTAATQESTSVASEEQPGAGSQPQQSPVGEATATAAEAPACGPVVVAAAKPAQPIARGLPGPGLLASVIVNKYVDHLPLHRQEQVFLRQGVLLHRSTTCDWLAACAELLRPLYDLMVSVVLQSLWLHTDDTTVKNQQPPDDASATARLWVYLGDRSHPYNVFDFTTSRKRDGPQGFLAGYRGYLHADAFSGYDALYLPASPDGVATIVEVACNAHARRKFYEARGSDALRAHRALAYYGQLYELERQARDWDDEARLRMRQELAVPILEQFKVWLDKEIKEVLPKSPMADAIRYALNHWKALIRYTEAGFLSIDNNVAEREMKRVAIGRKNWLFVGSARGGETAAVLLSFTSTCQRLGIEPWAYLQDVLRRLPTTPAEQLSELLPDRWQAAVAASTAATPASAGTVHAGESAGMVQAEE